MFRGLLAAAFSIRPSERQERRHPTLKRSSVETYRAIIVGGGTSGCMTAYTLGNWMQRANIRGRILLVDSGDRSMVSGGPHPKMWEWFNNWSKFSTVHETTGDGFYPAVASSHNGIGGCSTHDTRITFIPREDQLQRYASSMKWSIGRMRFFYQSVLNMLPLHPSSGGEDFYDQVIKTLDKSGKLTGIQDYKAQIVNDSIGYVSIAMFHDETRWTPAYLVETPHKPDNLDIITNTTVDKVLFDESKRAIGIRTSSGRMISADEIVLSSGALGVPAILQRSGIGPKKLLNDLGIPVIVENDEVGHGVDHMEIAVTYQWNPDRSPTIPRGGPMAWPLVIFFGDKHMAHFGISPPPYGGNEVTATPNCMYPDESDGFYATITSTNPNDPIKVQHTRSNADFKSLTGAIRSTIDMFETLRSSGIVGERVNPPASVTSDNQLEMWARLNVGTAYHWMCTARVGAVSDEHFKVKGVSNLRVGSGAALPEIPGANPHLTISAFAVALAFDLVESFSDIKHSPDEFSVDELTLKPESELRPNVWLFAHLNRVASDRT